MYPSTDLSSKVVVGCLVVQVVGAWWGVRDDFADVKAPGDVDKEDIGHLE